MLFHDSKIDDSHILFNKTKNDLLKTLEKNLYGDLTQPHYLELIGNNIIFKPTDLRDHLATPLINLTQTYEKRWLKIQLSVSSSNHIDTDWNITIQDENYAILILFDCLELLALSDKGNSSVYFELENEIKKIRLVINSNTGKETTIPLSISVEQINDNSLKKIESSLNPKQVYGIEERQIRQLQFLHEKQLYDTIANYNFSKIKDYYKDDPWNLNYLINAWEFVTKQTILTSYPYNAAFAMNFSCNASCIFCFTKESRNQYRKKNLDINDWERYIEILPYCRSICIPGPGEPLLHPQFELLVSNLSKYIDRRCMVYIITNGILLDLYLDFFKKSTITTFNISLNAASSEIHSLIMGVNKEAFERVLKNIRSLVYLRDTIRKDIIINLSFLVVKQNVHEISGFINLGNELNVDGLYIKPIVFENEPQLSSSESDHSLLISSNDPLFEEEIKEAKIAIKKSRVTVFARPELWNYNLIQPTQIRCNLIYNGLYAAYDFFKIRPCCILEKFDFIHPIDYDGSQKFFEVWNHPIMVRLRKSFMDGTLNECCKNCQISAEYLQ